MRSQNQVLEIKGRVKNASCDAEYIDIILSFEKLIKLEIPRKSINSCLLNVDNLINKDISILQINKDYYIKINDKFSDKKDENISLGCNSCYNSYPQQG